jgi:glycerate kinase
LLGAELTPGAPLVLEAVGLAERLAGADLCITGEGRLDETSRAGKAPAAVAAACEGVGLPCVALCGELALGPGEVRRMGFTAAFAVGRGVRPLEEALAATETDLAASAAAIGAVWTRAAGRGGTSGPT